MAVGVGDTDRDVTAGQECRGVEHGVVVVPAGVADDGAFGESIAVEDAAAAEFFLESGVEAGWDRAAATHAEAQVRKEGPGPVFLLGVEVGDHERRGAAEDGRAVAGHHVRAGGGVELVDQDQ